MLTFFLRCPLSIFDVFVITIIIIMTLAPLSIKSLVALKKESKLRASELLARAWCLCVSDSCQGVIFWSCHLPSIWKVWITKNTLYLSSEASLFSDVEGRGVEEMVTLPSPLPKVPLQTFFYFQNWKTSPMPKVPFHILIMMPLWFLLSLKTTLI